MTTNKTIDGVPRADLESICEHFEFGRYWQAMEGVKKLRALLDAPVECRCKRYGKDNPHWPCPVHAAPAAEHQGDPVVVVLPERKQTFDDYSFQGCRDAGWNECLDEVIRINK